MKCGFASREITPEAGIFLAGNGEYKSVGINDPLFARALVLEGSNEWAALISADLIGIELATVRDVRNRLESMGIGKPEHVFISCTHTHNGPHTRFSQKIFEKHRDNEYLSFLAEQIAGIVSEADRGKKPASMTCARGHAFENMNRRIVTPDGRAHFYNPRLIRERPDLAARVSGIADPELDALQFRSAEGPIILTAVHYAAHPLTIGTFSNVISADYPGTFVNNIEVRYNAPAVFFQGACGDLHSKGLFAGFGRMEEMGANLSEEAARALSETDCRVDDATLSVAVKDVKLPVDRNRMDKNRWTGLFGEYYEGEMGAIALGPVVFVTAPGEITCAVGLEIKWHSPFMQTWVLYNTNSYSGYISPQRYYVEGGYEGDRGQCLHPDACEVVLQTASELLENVTASSRGRAKSL